jgi:hypothetical protein
VTINGSVFHTAADYNILCGVGGAGGITNTYALVEKIDWLDIPANTAYTIALEFTGGDISSFPGAAQVDLNSGTFAYTIFKGS